jgi:hypothetical protein
MSWRHQSTARSMLATLRPVHAVRVLRLVQVFGGADGALVPPGTAHGAGLRQGWGTRHGAPGWELLAGKQKQAAQHRPGDQDASAKQQTGRPPLLA